MAPSLTNARRLVALTLCLAIVIAPCTAQEGPGIRIVVLEGEGAIHNIRASKVVELRVQLLSRADRPLPRVPVTFALPASGPGGVFADGRNMIIVLSDSQGQALARGFRPNGDVGQFAVRVTASFRGDTASAAVQQTNATPAAKRPGRTIALVAIVSAAVLGGVVLYNAVSNSPKPRQTTPFGSN